MSETTETTAVEPAETPGETPEGSDTGERNRGLVEARDRYRTERDTAREELTAANGRIDAMQTRELLRLAEEHLSVPADLLALSGKVLTDFVNENGEIDCELVRGTAEALVSTRPGLRPRHPAIDPSQGRGNTPRAVPSFSDLLKS